MMIDVQWWCDPQKEKKKNIMTPLTCEKENKKSVFMHARRWGKEKKEAPPPKKKKCAVRESPVTSMATRYYTTKPTALELD